jgi:hypothetical protein
METVDANAIIRCRDVECSTLKKNLKLLRDYERGNGRGTEGFALAV